MPLEQSEQTKNQITYIAMLLTQLTTCLLADTFTDQLTVNADWFTDYNIAKKDSITLHSHPYMYKHLAIFSIIQNTRTVTKLLCWWEVLASDLLFKQTL